ncbi:MAG TPA: hypothetical protein VFE98_05310 [Candidatus Bathyarchaeia archaeon]|nr:hypothetical protein [Candidatus Bathyarchaeia archaeon]
MGEKANAEVKNPAYPIRLVYAAIVLAIISAAFHLYIGIWIIGGTSGIVLSLIALVYIVGSILIAVDYKRKLFLKIGLGWVILVLILWAGVAAMNATGTNNIFAYLDKADELMLLAILVRIRMIAK